MKLPAFSNPEIPLKLSTFEYAESRVFLGIPDPMEGDWREPPKAIELNRKVLHRGNYKVISVVSNGFIYSRFKVVVETANLQTESPVYIDLDHCYTYMRGLRARGVKIEGLFEGTWVSPHELKIVTLMAFDDTIDEWLPLREGATSNRINQWKKEGFDYSEIVPNYLFPIRP